MECCDNLNTTTNTRPNNSLSSTIISSSSSPPMKFHVNKNSVLAAPPVVITSPCAACKILRRRCVEKCVLAPYFPPTEPLKFTTAHRVFGASNIIKLLLELPESQKEDAVSSMVYEANARLRDPVYGCTGAICHLQNQISELQAELAKAQAEIVNMQSQQANLLTLICKDSSQPRQDQSLMSHQPYENLNFFPDDVDLSTVLEPLWT